jgi:hypothetical protein
VRSGHVSRVADTKLLVILRPLPGICRALELGVKMLGPLVFVVVTALPSPVLAGAEAVLVALAEPAPLPRRPFDSQIRFTERVEVRGRVFARLLFGGRVMVLARDDSVLRITEVTGATMIAVETGRVAVTVDRANLHAEDLVEIRTPHAAVTVPSGTLVVEVADASTFTPVGRAVEVFRLDRLGGAAIEPPTVVAADEAVTVERAVISSGVLANR